LGQIKPGTVEVRISAPGCELHTSAIKSMTVFADFDTPPLWFPMTPRQVGRLDVTFELVQGGAVIASVAHTIRVTAGVENDPVASVKSHGGEPPEPVCRCHHLRHCSDTTRAAGNTTSARTAQPPAPGAESTSCWRMIVQPVMRGEEQPVEMERETERQRKEKRDSASEGVRRIRPSR
jgi:hypothetical protein